MKKTDLLTMFNKIAPFDLAEDFDNCGMQVDLGKEEINKVYLAMDVTEDVIEKAAECGADMIVSHHPMLLRDTAPCKIEISNVTSRNIINLVKKDIEVCALHTCFDAAPGGMNDYLCELFEIGKVQTFAGDIPRIGKLKEPVSFGEFEKLVFEKLGKPIGYLSQGDSRKLIKTVAVCSGAGGDLWEDALKAGADLFITGECKHHHAVYASQTPLCLIVAGHAGTEWIFVPALAALLDRYSLGQLEVVKHQDHQIPFDRTL